MKSFLRGLTAFGLVFAFTTGAAAQDDAGVIDENMRNVLEMMFSEINTSKIETLNQVMQLTHEEADVFWPIYREYEAELKKVGLEKAELLGEFLVLNESGSTDAATWDRLGKALIENRQKRLDLWRKYHKRLSKELSPVRAAQFLQIENQMAILIDLNIALEMPLVGEPATD